MAETLVQPRSVTRLQWIALALLVISVSINYIDRGILAVAAATPEFRTDMSFSDPELGLLFSAFFWSYALLQLAAGWLLDRYDVNRLYAAGFLLWSLVTLAMGLVSGFAALLLLRILLGAGEALAYPSISKIVASEFPEERRGWANSLVDAGSRSGPAIGVLLGGVVVAQFGWRALFVSAGAFSLLWLLPWFWYMRRAPSPSAAQKVRQTKGGVPALQILRTRQAWGTIIALFCFNYTWVFMLSWLPSYLVNERHFSTQMMAIFGSIPFWGIAVLCALCGWISDRMVERGGRPSRVRMGFVVTGLLLPNLMLPVALLRNDVVAMILLTLACAGTGLASSNFWAVTQTLAGPQAAGKWVGLQNGMGNFAGMLGPYVTGVLVARTGSYFIPFLAACASTTIGAFAYLFLVREMKPIDWDAATERNGGGG